MRWNLEQWGDGSTRLAYWDVLHGEDEIIVLYPDGRAEISNDDQPETINLAQWLYNRLAKFEED